MKKVMLLLVLFGLFSCNSKSGHQSFSLEETQAMVIADVWTAKDSVMFNYGDDVYLLPIVIDEEGLVLYPAISEGERIRYYYVTPTY